MSSMSKLGATAVVAFDGHGADVRPQWSPDGTKLVFERYAAATATS